MGITAFVLKYRLTTDGYKVPSAFLDAGRAMFGERFFRLWDLYLAMSEASFRAGIYVNYQVQLTKQIDSLPFTRDYMALPPINAMA